MSKAVVKADKEADRKNVVTPVRHIPYGVRRRLPKEVVKEVIVEKIVERIVEVEKSSKPTENSGSSEGKAETPVVATGKGRKGKGKASEASIESPAAQTAENSGDVAGSIEEKASAPITGEV